MPFQAVETQRLYQQVAEQVAALIRSGELRAGERLPPERDLARSLGVSRPTLREAMIALEIAGLVEVRGGSGIYVRPSPTPAVSLDAGPGAFELLAARILIEPEVAALAARDPRPAALATLEDSITALAAAADHRASQEADRRFHAAIAQATGNGVLVSLVESLWESMFSPIFERLSTRTGLPENRRMTLADHRTILDRVRARDPAGARSAMAAHLEHVRAILDSHDEAASSPDPATPRVRAL